MKSRPGLAGKYHLEGDDPLQVDLTRLVDDAHATPGGEKVSHFFSPINLPPIVSKAMNCSLYSSRKVALLCGRYSETQPIRKSQVFTPRVNKT
jgi:hypothetical protein